MFYFLFKSFVDTIIICFIQLLGKSVSWVIDNRTAVFHLLQRQLCPLILIYEIIRFDLSQDNDVKCMMCVTCVIGTAFLLCGVVSPQNFGNGQSC